MDIVTREHRKSRRMIAVVAAALMLVGWAGGTSALAASGPPATLACPDGFNLYDTSVLAGYSVGGLQSADLNHNTKTCIRFLDTPSDIVFMDDVVSSG